MFDRILELCSLITERKKVRYKKHSKAKRQYLHYPYGGYLYQDMNDNGGSGGDSGGG